MSLSDAQLEGIAAQAHNMAKRDLERGCFRFLLGAYHESESPGLHRLEKIERLIVEKLGEDWLNNGRTKDIGFCLLRKAVDLLPPDATVFVTVANDFAPTEKFALLTSAQQAELMNAGHDRHHQAVRDGLLNVCDALVAVVQTPERVCFRKQQLGWRGAFFGQPETHCGPQEGFGGRLKMFGEEKDDNAIA